MIRYEVTADVPAEARDAFVRFQTERHIPDVLASGCFRSAAFEEEADGRFRTSYVADDAASLERYLRDHAPGLRADFAAHAPAGVRLSRATWTALRSWPVND